MTFPSPSPLSYAEEASWAKLRRRGHLFFIITYGSLYGAGISGANILSHLLLERGHAHLGIFGATLFFGTSVIAGWICAAFFWLRQERRYKMTIAKFGKCTEGN